MKNIDWNNVVIGGIIGFIVLLFLVIFCIDIYTYPIHFILVILTILGIGFIFEKYLK